MASERTLSIIKPDAVAKNCTGSINSMFEAGGLRVAAQRMVRLSTEQAKAFYAVHSERPFYGDLVSFMTEGPVIAQVLEGEGAIARNREIMGATDPAKADDNTVRKAHGTNIERNAVHGSDSPENAAIEIAFFFSTSEMESLRR